LEDAREMAAAMNDWQGRLQGWQASLGILFNLSQLKAVHSECPPAFPFKENTQE
jgi:hypothetical protein